MSYEVMSMRVKFIFYSLNFKLKLKLQIASHPISKMASHNPMSQDQA